MGEVFMLQRAAKRELFKRQAAVVLLPAAPDSCLLRPGDDFSHFIYAKEPQLLHHFQQQNGVDKETGRTGTKAVTAQERAQGAGRGDSDV